TMQKLSLDALARELLGRAAAGERPGDSRESRTVVGGHEKALRQTVIALAKDAALAEHVSPGEATIIVLRGRVTLTAGTESWEGREGDLLILPDAPHSLTALADSAVLLTVAKLPLPAQSAASPAPPPQVPAGSGSQPPPFGKIKGVIPNEGVIPSPATSLLPGRPAGGSGAAELEPRPLTGRETADVGY